MKAEMTEPCKTVKAEETVFGMPDEVTLEYRWAFDADMVIQAGAEQPIAIPARSVIGCMAEAYLKGGSVDPTFDSLFLDGTVKWSDMTPVINETRSDPAPQSLVYLKYAKAYRNAYALTENDKKDKQKALSGMFATHDAKDGWHLASVSSEMVYHHRHEHDGADAKLYQHRTMSAGLIYAGRVTLPADLQNTVLDLLNAAEFRIGHSRSAQYSACRRL